MKDTPDFILKKQFEIIAQKTNAEKLQMTLAMMKTSYDMAYQLIKKQNPTFSHRQIIAKRFEMIHGSEFSKEEKARIIQHLLEVNR